MAIKRARDGHDESRQVAKKQRRGFAVGPGNLPEGRFKEKTREIKKHLIEKAKIKKDYAKVKRDLARQQPAPTTHDHDVAPADSNIDNHSEPTTDKEDRTTPSTKSEKSSRPDMTRKRPPKSDPFAAEQRQAQKTKAEAEARRKAREEAQIRRQAKLQERERFKRTMAKARTGGKNGQRKLGLESKVLLEKVSRLASEGKL